MSRSKHLSLIPAAVYALTGLAMPLVASVSIASAATTTEAKVVTPATYQTCMAKLKKIDDVSVLRGKAINPAVDRRLSEAAQLQQKAAQLPQTLSTTTRTGITDALKADIAFLNQIKTTSAKTTDVRVLQDNYCQAVYKTQLYQFRAPQIFYLNKIGLQIRRETRMQTVLNSPANTTYNSRLKAAADQRFNNARALMAASLTAENNAAAKVASASVDANFTNNLQKPTYDGVDTAKNYSTAYRDYTEAWALRTVAKSYLADRTLTLNSVSLSDKDGKPTDNLKDLVKATVSVKVSSQAGESTKTLTRPNAVTAWKIAN